jgi:hypothetical protein
MRHVSTSIPAISATSFILAGFSLALLSPLGGTGVPMFLVLSVIWAIIVGRCFWKEQKHFEDKLEEARLPRKNVFVHGSHQMNSKDFSPVQAWGDFYNKKFISIDSGNGLIQFEDRSRGVQYYDAAFFEFYRVNADTTLITEGKVGGSPAFGVVAGGVGVGYSMSKNLRQTTREHKKYKLRLFYEGDDGLLKDIEIDFQDNVKPLEQVVYALEKAVNSAGSMLTATTGAEELIGRRPT